MEKKAILWYLENDPISKSIQCVIDAYLNKEIDIFICAEPV